MKTKPEIMSAVRLKWPGKTPHLIKARALVLRVNKSAFGLTCWLLWNNGQVSIMHADQLEQSNLLL